MRNLLIAATMIAAALAAPMGAQAATPTSHERDLGSLNLNAYCAHVYGGNYKSSLLDSQTANDWYCTPIIHHAGATNHHLSKTPMTAACLFEYHRIGVYAKALRHTAGGNWQCFVRVGPFNQPL